MRRPRAALSVGLAATVLLAIPAATAIGGNFRDPSEPRIQAQVAAGTAFSYQGRLTDNGALPTGTYDLRFTLYDAVTAGNQVTGTQVITREDVSVANGLFTVSLDFGADVFAGDSRWLEIAVKPGSSGSFVTLTPRQPILAVPQALYAHSAGALELPASAEADLSATALDISQLGAGGVIRAQRNYNGATEGVAVLGENAGAGVAVRGNSTHDNGIAIQGNAIGLAGIGGTFRGVTGIIVESTGAGNALEVEGAVEVHGDDRFAFVHTASAGNTYHNLSWFESPADGDPSAAVLASLVVQASPPASVPTPPEGTATPSAVTGISASFDYAVVYVPEGGIVDSHDLPIGARGNWAIIRTDGEPIPAGTKFSVIVVRQGE